MEQERVSVNVEWKPQNSYAEKHIPRPKPAKTFMPEWYKLRPPFQTGHHPQIINTKANSTEKMCMPLMDSFSLGYIQEAWCDIFVQNTNDGIEMYQANDAQSIFKIGEKSYAEGKICPSGYIDISASWWTQWEPKTPNGWSTLYTHPLNQNLPFYTMSGVIDTDQWWHGGSVPFFLREGFEGVIPSGTPLYQIIFIKRENWKSTESEYKEDEMRSLYDSVFNKFYGGYKKLKWAKKNYE